MSTAALQMIDGVPTYNLFIGGEWVPSSRNEATASYNPATGDIYARVHQAGARETEAAIGAAHGAYKDWADKIVSEREAVFLRAADVLAAKTKEIVDVLIEESGSVAGKAGFEVGYCFDLLRTAASELRRSPRRDDGDHDAGAVRLHHPPAARRDRRDRAVQRAVPPGDEEGRACPRRRQRLRVEAFGANAGDRPEDRRSVRRGRSAKGIAQRNPRTGQFYWPTVLKGVTPDMRIFHEESFGPVTSIIKVKDHNEAPRNRQQHFLRTVVRRHHQRPAEGPRLCFQARCRDGTYQRLHRCGRAARAVWRRQEQRVRARGRPASRWKR